MDYVKSHFFFLVDFEICASLTLVREFWFLLHTYFSCFDLKK